MPRSAQRKQEIAGGPKPVGNRPGANSPLDIKSGVPPAAPHHPTPEATGTLHAVMAAPSAEGDGAGGQSHCGDQRDAAPGAIPPETIAALVSLQRLRRFCIVSQSRINRSCEAFIVNQLGLPPEADAAARKAAFKQASAFRKKVEAGGEGQMEHDHHKAAALIVRQSAIARESWDTTRKNAEKDMRDKARTLPAYAWVQTVAGLSDLGLAIIVAETGDLANYATKERVWKRLGLAVIEGGRQRRVSDAEDAKLHGFNPQRRAEIWAICSDSMFRQQWRGARDAHADQPAVAARPIGPYGAVYARRKAATEGRDWPPARRDADARRIMTKAVVEDLWRVWRGLSPLHGTTPGIEEPADGRA